MTVTAIGTNTSLGNTNTLAVTVPVAGVAIGQDVLVAAVSGRQIATPTSCADSRGNTYTRDVVASTGTAANAAIFRARVTTALVSADTITVTWDIASLAKAVSAVSVDDLAVSTPLDATGTANGSGVGSAPTVSTSAPTVQAAELAIGCAVHADTGTWTQPAVWVEDLDATINVRGTTAAHLTLAATGTVTYDPDSTSITSAVWAAVVATYKKATAAAGHPTMRRWGGSIQPTGAQRIGRGW